MARNWFYVKDGRQCGPVSFDELQQMAGSGMLEPSDVVWTELMDQWQPLSSVGEFQFAAPSPAARSLDPAVVGGPAPPLHSLRDAHRRRSASSSFWTSLRFVGAALLVIAFFVPWWTMTVYKADRSQTKLRRLEIDARVAQSRRIKWYEKNIGRANLAALQAARPRSLTTVRLWGWGSGCGVGGLLFGLSVIASVVVHLRVPGLHRWEWINCFACGLLGLAALLFFLVWLEAPGQDVEPILSQGISLGPYLALLGGLTLSTGGIVGGVQGLRDFLATL